MTNGIPPDWQDPAHENTRTDILSDCPFPRVPRKVHEILGSIRKHNILTPASKQEWIIAIASIFEENNIQDITYKNPLDDSMLNSKIKEAEKILNAVINSATDIDKEGYDMIEENKRIIICFKEFIIKEQRLIYRNKT